MGSMNDPIADLLTRIRNATDAEHRYIDIEWSKMKEAIVQILKNMGFIAHYLIKEENKKSTMRVFLKYANERTSVIQGIKRVSKPSARHYIGHDEIPTIMGGLGIVILSTPKGVMDGKQAHQQKLGGEHLCTVW
jgi:small subunit ribosomal protein S8